MTECLVCDHGQVELRVGIHVAEVITCPECQGSGELVADEAAKQAERVGAFNIAMSQERL